MRSCRIVRAQWALSCCLSVFGQKSKRGDLRVNKADFLEMNTAKFHYVTEPFNVISKACRLVTTGCFWVFFFFVVALWNVTTKSAQRSLHEKKKMPSQHIFTGRAGQPTNINVAVSSLRWRNTELPATSHLSLQWTAALQLWMREHAWTDTCTRTKKKRKKLCNTPLPPLFPSAHIHSDSSLCSHIAIRGTRLTSTSLTGCLLSFIDCNPANPEVMTEECYCSKVSMKKALWRAGLGGGGGGGGGGGDQWTLTEKRVTQGQRGDKQFCKHGFCVSSWTISGTGRCRHLDVCVCRCVCVGAGSKHTTSWM